MKRLDDLLSYRNLKIYQDDQYFCFSLDSVLLANFVRLGYGNKKIIDLGTGTLPIPLILSTKTNNKIYAIEIQKELYDLAKETLDYNQLSHQINLINDDMKKLSKYFSNDFFDIMIVNPPYFDTLTKKLKNEIMQKAIARHEQEIKLEEILLLAKKHLKNNGYFYMVHRPSRMIEIIQLFKKFNIQIKSIQLVYPNREKDANIMLIEGTKNGKVGLKIHPPLYIYDHLGNYTEEIKKRFTNEVEYETN